MALSPKDRNDGNDSNDAWHGQQTTSLRSLLSLSSLPALPQSLPAVLPVVATLAPWYACEALREVSGVRLGFRVQTLAGVAMAVLLAVPSAEVRAQETGGLLLSVRDAETGAGVPARVLVRPTGRPAQRLATDATGRLSISAAPGHYRLAVRAAGGRHRPLRTTLVIEADRDWPVELLLDPAGRPARPRAALADQVVFAGTVIDQVTLQPLAAVRVHAAGAGGVAVTGADGSFRLALGAAPVADGESGPPGETLVFSLSGYVTHELRGQPLVGGETRLRVDLVPGSGREVVEPSLGEGTGGSPQGAEERVPAAEIRDVSAALTTSATLMDPPDTIRVGTSCSCATCSSVSVMSLDTYTRRGLNNEWIASWNAHSLRAGAIAYRSYGAYHVYHPRAASYDICSTTCCQAYDTTTSTSTDTATNYTSGFMVRNGTEPAFAEYSAENNDLDGSNGCGDCYVGNNGSWSCLYDVVGCGYARNGHGRGMSQWGSQRWANAQGEDWRWIVDHYYNDRPTPKYYLTSPLTITSASGTPSTVAAGQGFTINVNGTSYAESSHAQIMLGASLCSGSCNVSDPANDTKVTVTVGAHGVSRPFTVPAGTPAGTYDLLVAYWFDVDENNAIGSGDLIVASRQEPGAIVIGAATATHTRTVTQTGTATATATRTATATGTATSSASATRTHTATPPPAQTPTLTPTAPATSTATETAAAAATATQTRTATPISGSGAAACAPAPVAGCGTAGRASLKMRDTGDPFRHQLLWKWGDGVAARPDFGDPVSGDTTYRLCVYDQGSLVLSPLLEAGSFWTPSSRGFKYTNLLTNASGIYKALLKDGAGNARILVKGRGTSLGASLGLPYAAGGVVTQFVKTDAAGTQCWEAAFAAESINDGERFKAKMP